MTTELFEYFHPRFREPVTIKGPSHILVHGVWIENVHEAELRRPPMWPVWVKHFKSLERQGRNPMIEWEDSVAEAEGILENYEWSVVDDR